MRDFTDISNFTETCGVQLHIRRQRGITDKLSAQYSKMVPRSCNHGLALGFTTHNEILTILGIIQK